MARVSMVAKRRFAYAGKVIESDQHFEADTEQDANVLVVAGHAAPSSNEDAPREKRAYRRRDMRAEH